MSRLLKLAGQAIGIVAGGATAALWILVIYVEIGGFMLEGYGAVVGAFMALFGMVAAIASFHGHAGVVFVCFVASFFGVGAFALNVDHWFRIFGILDLALLAASVMIWLSTRQRETTS